MRWRGPRSSTPTRSFDEATGRRWVSRAEVAETEFTAFVSGKKSEQVAGRLVVRRIPDFNADKNRASGQSTLFDVSRLPQAWPWQTAWTEMFDRISDPSPAVPA